MLSASTETTASLRPVPLPSGRDVRRPDTGFAALVDDNAAAKADAAPAPRETDAAPRRADDPSDTAAPDNHISAPEANTASPADTAPAKPKKDEQKQQDTAAAAPASKPDGAQVANTDAIVPSDSAASTPAPAPQPTQIAVIAPLAAPQIAVQTPPITAATTAPAPLALAAAALATAKAAGIAASGPVDAEPATETGKPAPKTVATPQIDGKLAAGTVTAGTDRIATGLTGESTVNEPATTAPQPAAAAKPTAHAEAAKPDTEAASDPLATPAPQPATHEHRATAAAAPDPAVAAPVPAAPSPATHAAAPATPTAQLTATVATAAPVPLNGLAVELATRAQSGNSRFEIRLDPAELGRIDVRIDIDRDGNVKSHLTVEKPETLAMLRQDSPQLQRALNDAGLKTADSGLQFTLGDQSQPRQNTDNGDRNTQRFIIRDDETATPATPVRGYGRMTAARSGVDISV